MAITPIQYIQICKLVKSRKTNKRRFLRKKYDEVLSLLQLSFIIKIENLEDFYDLSIPNRGLTFWPKENITL